MRIGVPRETLRHEHRVGLTPFGVSRLRGMGHDIYVEHDAGKNCHFGDGDYTAAGANLVYRAEEVYQRSDIVCRVGPLGPDEVALARSQSTICAFHHLAVASRDVVTALMTKQVSLIGYEVIERPDGHRPVLTSLSEIAGQMAVHTAAHLLEHTQGGRGLLLGSVPGIPPATVVILGAGTVGTVAARTAVACGAHVIVLDADIERLRLASHRVGPQLVTAVASTRNLTQFTAIADVLIGAILIPGGRTPFLITQAMVASMKPGSVVLDLSIDQGGCVETSRPTNLDSPTFKVNGVTHYCVPNMTAAIPRTASRALTIAALPYLTQMADRGVAKALGEDTGLGRGVYLYLGKIVNAHLAEAMGQKAASLASLI